jgi:cytochrome c-type biogenesis protein CcmH
VRERLKAGDSDAQVIGFLTDRYGDFVLLKPRMSARTVLLWALPALVLVGGGLGLLLVLRRRRGAGADAAGADSPAPLTPAEQKRLAALTEERR